MALAFRFAARSDVGRIRSKNDDSAYAGRHLAVVADGMGGHVGGDVASASAVIDLTHLDRDGYAGRAVTELADEIQNANQNLAELVRQQPRLAGMGTTVTSLLIDGDQIALCHIGDSRAYRLRGDAFEQITTDHTFVQRLIEEGRLRPEEAETHPHRNVLMRVLGDVDASPELEAEVYDAAVGERWLLCSDGLNAVVKPSAIEELLRSDAELDEIAQTLVRATLQRGAPDNVTVAVLEVVDAADLSPIDTEPTGAVPDPDEALTSDQLTERARSSAPDRGSEAPETPAPWAAAEPDHEDGPGPRDSSAAELRRGLDELPHVLVGAAANATQTGRIPTVSDSAAARRATLVRTSAADSLTDIAEVDSALGGRGARRRGRVVGALVGLVVIAALVVAGLLAQNWVREQYYVGSDGSHVAIYQGISQSLGPISLSEIERTTDLPVDDLPGYARSRVESTIAAEDLGQAESIVLGLRSDADRFDREQQEEASDGESPADEPSPSETGTVSFPEAEESAPAATAGADDGGQG
ncbi:PP2C family serine/threonine-protein phosphatase [Kocuria palustris]|uniref:PP2C family protein-serine/threonine phosphatase n=1 Tax=Kocuria palustris TaxID=71999 RepID=UPI0011A52041|nr:protein phosphatase 2C domain-containing protein [Kocuria palustris]